MKHNYLRKWGELPKPVKASFWFLMCSFLQKGVTVITTPIFTRLLNTSEYGQYGVFNSWLNIVTVFVSMRMYYGTYSQGLVKYEDDRKRFSSSMEGLLLSLVLGWTIIYLLFYEFWNNLFNLTTVQMLAMLVMIWTTGVFSFWADEQRIEFRYKKLVAITVLVSIAKPLIGVIFVINATDKVTARILGLALVELIGYFGLFVVQMKRGKTFFYKEYWKRALLLNVPLIPHYLSQTVLNSADRIMIKQLIGSSESGIYSLANSLSQMMTLFNTALLQTLNPWVFKKLKKKEISGIAPIIYFCMVFVAVINIFLMAIAPELVMLFAPKSYYEAIWVIPPVSMSVYFVFCYVVFAEYEFYYEKTKHIMVISLIGASLNIVLNYIFIPKYGYLAAGYTTLICYFVYCMGHYYMMRQVCKENLGGESIFKQRILILISLVFVALGFLFLFSYNYIMIRYTFIIILFVLIIIFRGIILKNIRTILTMRKQK